MTIFKEIYCGGSETLDRAKMRVHTFMLPIMRVHTLIMGKMKLHNLIMGKIKVHNFIMGNMTVHIKLFMFTLRLF